MPRPTIKLYLLSRVQLKGRGIMMRVSCESKGEPVHFYTGFVIEPKSWDEKKQRVNSRYLLATVINSFLDTWQVQMEGLITNLELKAKPYTLKELQQAFNRQFRSKQSGDWKSLLSVFPEWLRKGGRKVSTVNSHESRIHAFKKFMEGNITTEKIHDYVDFMFDVEKLEPGFIKKRLDTVKLLLKFLNENQVECPQSYKPRRKIKVIKKPAVALRPDEYKRLLAYKPSTDRLQRIKDMAVIGYNTALRISDSRITPGDIDEGRIIKMSQKMDTSVGIPISEALEEILIRYDYKPPYISGQKLNNGLKELFKEIGLTRKVKVIHNKGGVRTEEIKELWEIASSKITGRAAFVSAMKAAGVPNEYIRAVTGHASDAEMEPYISVNTDEAAKKVKQALGG